MPFMVMICTECSTGSHQFFATLGGKIAAGITVVGEELGQTALGIVILALVGAGLVMLSRYRDRAFPQAMIRRRWAGLSVGCL